MYSSISTNKLEPLQRQNAAVNEQKAVDLMKEFNENIKAYPTGLCFGFEKPTALDGHLVVFIARMLDIGRIDVIPTDLKQYATRLMAGDEWKGVMQGRSTLAPE